MLQQFVRTADLDKVYTAANKVFASEKPTNWKLKAFKYYYMVPSGIRLEFGGGISGNMRLSFQAARSIG